MEISSNHSAQLATSMGKSRNLPGHTQTAPEHQDICNAIVVQRNGETTVPKHVAIFYQN
jgi:hypothetical protein